MEYFYRTAGSGLRQDGFMPKGYVFKGRVEGIRVAEFSLLNSQIIRYHVRDRVREATPEEIEKFLEKFPAQISIYERTKTSDTEKQHRSIYYRFYGYKHPTQNYIVEVDDNGAKRLHHANHAEAFIEGYG